MLALLLVLVGACGGDDEPADADERPSSATTTTLSLEAEVEQAYRDFIEMTKSLYLTPDPTDPRIAEHATGDTRATLEANVTQMQAEGIQFRIGQDDKQTILSTMVDGDTATLSVCYVGHSGSFDTATGAEVQPMRVTTSLIEASLRLEAGRWRVSVVAEDPEQIWEGAYSCGA